ncbi:MAG: SIR2 family protein [Phycisphaerae bacterium]
MEIQIPESLKQALIGNKLVLFIGAGLSIPSKAPSWPKLIQELVECCKNEGMRLTQLEIDEIEYLIQKEGSHGNLLAADFLKRKLEDKMHEHIQTRFISLSPSRTHKLIADLNVNLVTTNFDMLLEESIKQVTGEYPTIYGPNDEYNQARLSDDKRWIYKMHGCCKYPDKTILTNSDYLNIRECNKATLQKLLQTKTALFIGSSLSDPDVLACLLQVSSNYRNNNPRHYALVEEKAVGAIKRDWLMRNYRIQAIAYKKSNDQHPEVPQFLKGLLELQNTQNVDRISKILLIVTAIKKEDDGSSPALLVTDSNPQWCIKEGAQEFRAFLLPSVKNVSDDVNENMLSIAKHLDVSLDDIEIRIDENVFSTKKLNPATNRITEYSFKFAEIKFKKRIGRFELDNFHINNRKYSWQSVMFLREHEPSQKLNCDVFVEVSKRYGANLEQIPSSLYGAVVNSDPYEIRSLKYGDMAWVNDVNVFEKILSSELKITFNGVLDLGCGQANLGKYICEHKNYTYVGYDTSSKMLYDGRQKLATFKNFQLHCTDITSDYIKAKYDGWLFVLKNVLHLIKSPYQMFKGLPVRFGSPAEIVIVETVSPNLECSCWIQALFDLFELPYKKNWFLKEQLPILLDLWGYKVSSIEYVEQLLDVSDWLQSFPLNDTQIEAIQAYIENCPEAVRKEMKLLKKPSGSYQMLRLQGIFKIQL